MAFGGHLNVEDKGNEVFRKGSQIPDYCMVKKEQIFKKYIYIFFLYGQINSNQKKIYILYMVR